MRERNSACLSESMRLSCFMSGAFADVFVFECDCMRERKREGVFKIFCQNVYVVCMVRG